MPLLEASLHVYKSNSRELRRNRSFLANNKDDNTFSLSRRTHQSSAKFNIREVRHFGFMPMHHAKSRVVIAQYRLAPDNSLKREPCEASKSYLLSKVIAGVPIGMGHW